MLQSHQVPVLWIKLVEVSEIEKLLVVLESAFFLHFYVSGVHFRNHHIRQYASENISHSHHCNVGTPVVVVLLEVSPPYCFLYQAFHAGVETRAGVILREKDREEVAPNE